MPDPRRSSFATRHLDPASHMGEILADEPARSRFYDAVLKRVRSGPSAPNPIRREDLLGDLAAGWRAALHTLVRPWLSGLVFMLVGVLLVAVAIPLGG